MDRAKTSRTPFQALRGAIDAPRVGAFGKPAGGVARGLSRLPPLKKCRPKQAILPFSDVSSGPARLGVPGGHPRGPVRTRSRSFLPLLARSFLLSTPHTPCHGYMPLKHPLGFWVPHSRIFGASRCPVAESRDQGSFLKTAPTKILTTEVVRICRAPGEEPFLGLFPSRAARWMCRAWVRLASPQTVAFTAHVTIHVREFSPQIFPKLTGMRYEIGA